MKAEEEVSAAEVVRHFSHYREAATVAPVRLTHHGRRTHVLLGEDLYRNLLEQASSASLASSSGDGRNLVYTLADWIDEGLIICGPDYVVQFANRVALAICSRRTDPLPEVSLFKALPELAGSLMEVHVRRTMIGGEPSSADMPSPFAKDAWLRFQSFPLGDSIVLKFRDITDDVHHHRLADMKEAILNAMDVDGIVGYVRLSVRGTIERTNQPFCKLVDLPDERLQGVLMGDVVEIAHRSRFREALERVLRGEGSQKIAVDVISNSGRVVPVLISMVQLQGAYGAEGAVLLVLPTDTRDDEDLQG